MLRSAALALAAVALGCGENERWSKQDWAQAVSRAEARLPPPPTEMKSLSCGTDKAEGNCFLDPDERRIRNSLLLDALRLQWGWTQELCERFAANTRRTNWPTLAAACAQARSYYLNGLRGSGTLDDTALVEAYDRDGRAEYVHFVAALTARLGSVREGAWHKELRIAASRRGTSAPQLSFPLPAPGCGPGDDSVRDCMLVPEKRFSHRTEILRNFLHTWMEGLWRACETRAQSSSPKDFPALASACLDFRDLATKLATTGIRLKDSGLIDCKGLSVSDRDWPRLIEERLAGRDAKSSPDKPSPCEDPSIEGPQ